MKLNKSFWIKLGIESLLIVFSVLLALALNAFWAGRNEAERTRQVLLSIREELKTNQAVVKELNKIHREVLNNLKPYRSDTASYQGLIDNHRFQFGKLYPGSLVPETIRSTAWETAQSTGVIQNFDLELANSLSSTYEQQEIGIMNSIERLAGQIFDRKTHNNELLPQTLALFDYSFSELVGQENALLVTYNKELKKLDAALEQ